MVKRTIHFSNPAHLSTRNRQLLIELKDASQTSKTIPIEDLGVVVLENPQITLTASVLESLLEQQVAVITCNRNYMPSGMFLPLEGNSTQTERMRTQLEASLPLKKQLWQQTIRAKIFNQAMVLERMGIENKRLLHLQQEVMSGDAGNCEAKAAAYYWSAIFGPRFTRDTDQRQSPNAQLNYGYAILRSLVARALVSSGLLPSFGIHHRNKYNAFCLADDIMEPYRPFVDLVVLAFSDLHQSEGLTKEQKVKLLQLPQLDITIESLQRPLFHAVSNTTASLYRCFEGIQRKISYPEL